MASFRSLLWKNFSLLFKMPFITVCLISLPFFALLFSLFAIPQFLDTDYFSRLNYTKVTYSLNEKLSLDSVEVYNLTMILKDKTIGVLMEETDDELLLNINKTFFDFLMNEQHGICKKKDNCTIIAFKKEIDYIMHSSKEPIIEVIDIFKYSGRISLNLYSRNFPLYSRENQMSQLYNIPTIHEINYIHNILVYFTKYLKEFARDPLYSHFYPNFIDDKDANVTITIYPMNTTKFVRMIDDHSDKYPYPESCIVYVSNCFIGISASFIGIFYLFSNILIEEKRDRIRDLLRFQGITTFTYVMSWLLTYLALMIIPMILFMVLLFIVWLKLQLYTVISACIVMILHSLNTISMSFLSTCFVSGKNQSKWGVYITYMLSLLFYFFFQLFQEYDYWLKMIFYLFPTVNFAIALEFLFLGTNYEKGMTFDIASRDYKNTNFIQNVIFNIISLLLSILLFSMIEFFSNRNPNINARKDNNEEKNLMKEKAYKKGGFERKFEDANDLALRAQIEKGECLIVKNISKTYQDFKAVKNFSCKFYKGQIFVLLGENGAGKTTLLSMISGKKTVDQGEIILDGIDLVKNRHYLYSNLGLCLQEDIFFNEMTVKEQLELICDIKLSGKKNSNKNYHNESQNLISKLGLSEFENTKGNNLSGGNLRKLCVAFALVGNSKLVILDEPTSGMDFKSKKQFWDFLKSVKKDRIIILTTHSMEEAEYLGDSIGIMSEGELICKGSSSFLKNSYPCGFNINFILQRNEVSFKEKAELIFELKQLEPQAVIKVLGKDLIKINFPEKALKESKINALFKTIEQLKDKYKILNYTVSTASLEDVFFKVNDNEFTRNLFEKELKDIMEEIEKDYREKGLLNLQVPESEMDESLLSNSGDFSAQLLYLEDEKPKDIEVMEDKSEKKDTIIYTTSPALTKESLASLIQDDYTGNQIIAQTAIGRHFRRFVNTEKRRYLFLIFQVIISCVFLIYTIVLKPMGVTKYFYFFFVRDFYPTSFQSYYQLEGTTSNNVSDYIFDPKITLISDAQISSDANYTEISLYKNFDKIKHYQIIKQNDKELQYINFYAPASPSIMHVITNAILIKYLNKIGINVSLLDGYTLSPQEFLSSNVQKFSYNTIITSLISISHLICCSFFIFLPLHDNLKEIKTLISLSMGEMQKYWISMFLFHYIKFICFAILSYIIIAFQIKEVLPLFPASMFYGITFILLAYLFTFIFPSGRAAVSIYLVFNLVLILITLYLQQISNIQFEMNYLVSLYDLWPTTAFTHLLFELRQNQLVNNVYLNIPCFIKLLIGIGVSLVQNLVISFCIFCFENGKIKRCLHSIKKCFIGLCKKKASEFAYDLLNENERKKHLLSVTFSSGNSPNSSLSLSLSEDSVAKEKEKIQNNKDIFTFFIQNLTVTYKNVFSNDVRAVNQIFMGLEPNEKFALMGYSGAGKTSIIKSIINSIEREDGYIEFLGMDLSKQFDQIKDKIGYCPQVNSLFDYLTVKETFEFFDRGIINIQENDPRMSLEENYNEKLIKLLSTFGLYKYKDVLTKNLSGGNKRKVVFAIALMNNPQLALLDEPSTGVDPDSRRLMWKNITSIHRAKKNKGYNFNLILSTQSFEEAEVLCDSLGWMKHGSFAYIGNSESLKLQLSAGYYLKIRFKKPTTAELDEIMNNSIVFENIKEIEEIQRIDIQKEQNEKNYELLYYLYSLDIFSGVVLKGETKMKLLDFIENDFLLVLIIHPKRKGYVFANLLNIKHIQKEITEISIGIQPFETFIEGM